MEFGQPYPGRVHDVSLFVVVVSEVLQPVFHCSDQGEEADLFFTYCPLFYFILPVQFVHGIQHQHPFTWEGKTKTIPMIIGK